MSPFTKRFGLLVVAAALTACSGAHGVVPNAGFSQSVTANPPQRGAVVVTAADRAAARQVRSFSYHLFPLSSHWKATSGLRNDTTVKYPADLRYFGGPLMKTAVEHDVYVNCKTNDQSCWGKPERFLKNLGTSQLIKLLTQYTKASAGAYTFGEGTPVTYSAFSHYFYDNDLFSILHSVVKAIGKSGYGDEYHIFLPKGVDNCFDGTSICYSPDVPSTWYFCAYHGEVTFGDVGAVVFSVLPFQNVNVRGVGGCIYPNLPSGYSQLVNSTDSTLAHEMFESITDPNPNTFRTLGWYNIPYNQEIADLCVAFPKKMAIGSGKYFIQTMYSNKYHGCANGP